jgi:hypothetical protein
LWLAEIDPRPFQVQLAQAEGQMARDQALLVNAKLDLERYRVLFSQDSVPKQQLDTQESLVRQYEGVVRADQGQVDNAKLQLSYCRITAPIRGRVGLRLVDVGNVVHASDANGLVVITQLQPITVVFAVPEDNLPEILKNVKTGQKLPVEAYDREQKRRLATGALASIDAPELSGKRLELFEFSMFVSDFEPGGSGVRRYGRGHHVAEIQTSSELVWSDFEFRAWVTMLRCPKSRRRCSRNQIDPNTGTIKLKAVFATRIASCFQTNSSTLVCSSIHCTMSRWFPAQRSSTVRNPRSFTW